jgi:hypothetical protein
MASQENKTPDPAGERRKKILAGALVVAFVLVLLWQFGVFTGNEQMATTRTVAAQPYKSPTPKGSPTPARVKPEDQVVDEPLRPEFAFYKNTPLDGSGRNIFVYPTPTPAPTPPPAPPPPTPVPPPITLVGILPGGVIGRTGDFTLTVTGLKFPQDARIFLDGREIKTSRQDESHLTGQVTADMIRNAGNLGVQVRSASDPQMYSNQVALNVAEPPPPPYKFVGVIIGKQGAIAVLRSQGEDEVINVKKGEFADKKTKRWEVRNITSQRVEFFDTQVKLTHFVNFTAEGEK